MPSPETTTPSSPQGNLGSLPQDPAALLHTREAARLLGLSPRTLESLRLRGGGPPFVSVTKRAVRYRRSDLEAWIRARLRRSTSDVPAALER